MPTGTLRGEVAADGGLSGLRRRAGRPSGGQKKQVL